MWAEGLGPASVFLGGRARRVERFGAVGFWLVVPRPEELIRRFAQRLWFLRTSFSWARREP